MTSDLTRWSARNRADPQEGGMPERQAACPCCHVKVRGLYASAHNSLIELDRLARGEGSKERGLRKLAELRQAVEDMKPLIDAHFADPSHWKATP